MGTPDEVGELWTRLVVGPAPQVAPGSQKMAPEIRGAKFEEAEGEGERIPEFYKSQIQLAKPEGQGRLTLSSSVVRSMTS